MKLVNDYLHLGKTPSIWFLVTKNRDFRRYEVYFLSERLSDCKFIISCHTSTAREDKLNAKSADLVLSFWAVDVEDDATHVQCMHTGNQLTLACHSPHKLPHNRKSPSCCFYMDLIWLHSTLSLKKQRPLRTWKPFSLTATLHELRFLLKAAIFQDSHVLLADWS